jgi:hypothetical protein
MPAQKHENDLNASIEQVLNERPRYKNISESQRSSVDLYRIEPATKGDRYNQFNEQLQLLKDGLKEYLQKEFRKKEVQQRQRRITEMVPADTAWNYIRKLCGWSLKEVPIEKTFLEKVETDVPLNEGTADDLQNMIYQSADTLEKFNREVAVTVRDIDSVTSNMRILQKQYLARLIEEKKSFEKKDSDISRNEELLQQARHKLERTKITDQDFERTVNNHDDLENHIIRSKYELQSHHTRAVLFTNQKNALRVYEQCLDLAKYTTMQMMDYVDNFTSIVRQLNISVKNVDIVCNFLAQTLEEGQETVKLMHVGQKCLAGMLELAKRLYEDPPTGIVDVQPFIDKIASQKSELESRIVVYKQQQKSLEQMAKPFCQGKYSASQEHETIH